MRQDVLLGAESTHLFLDVQLVFELPVGQVMSGLGLFPLNQAVGPGAVHADIVGWAKYFCNENPGHSPEPVGICWASEVTPSSSGSSQGSPRGLSHGSECCFLGKRTTAMCAVSAVSPWDSLAGWMQRWAREPKVREGRKYGDWAGMGALWGQPRHGFQWEDRMHIGKDQGAPVSFHNEWVSHVTP